MKAAYHQVIVTPAVASEFGQTLPPWIAIQSPVNQSMIQLLEETIDPGEASSITLAVEIKDCYLILDDFRARKVAHSKGLLFTGALGETIKTK